MSQVTGSCGAPCYTIFLEATLSGVNYSDRSSYQLRGGRSQVPIYATVFSRGRLAELTYVRLLLVVHGSLRATFMWRQYSSLDTARAVMSRWRNYVIGPRGALPILPLLQLLLPRLPQGVVLLSARASIIVGIIHPGDVRATRSLRDRRKFAIRGPGVPVTILPMFRMSLISPREDSGVS